MKRRSTSTYILTFKYTIVLQFQAHSLPACLLLCDSPSTCHNDDSFPSRTSVCYCCLLVPANTPLFRTRSFPVYCGFHCNWAFVCPAGMALLRYCQTFSVASLPWGTLARSYQQRILLLQRKKTVLLPPCSVSRKVSLCHMIIHPTIPLWNVVRSYLHHHSTRRDREEILTGSYHLSTSAFGIISPHERAKLAGASGLLSFSGSLELWNVQTPAVLFSKGESALRVNTPQSETVALPVASRHPILRALDGSTHDLPSELSRRMSWPLP